MKVRILNIVKFNFRYFCYLKNVFCYYFELLRFNLKVRKVSFENFKFIFIYIMFNVFILLNILWIIYCCVFFLLKINYLYFCICIR